MGLPSTPLWAEKATEFMNNLPFSYPRIIISLVLLEWCFEIYVRSRQQEKLSQKSTPASIRAFAHLMPENKDDSSSTTSSSDKSSTSSIDETFQRSQSYARDKISFANVTTTISVIQTVFFFTNLLQPYFAPNVEGPWSGLRGLWDLAAKLDGRVPIKNEISQTFVFFAISMLLDTILSIPISLFNNFVLEEKHGFNKMTMATFWKDLVKSTLLGLVFMGPILSALVWIVRWAGPSFVQWTTVFIMGLSLVAVVVYPYINRLFNTFKPLSDFKDKPNYVESQKRIEALASGLGFPLKKITVIDGSVRSSHSNAYFMGLPFLKKEIVLYDTLLDTSTPEEVEAVMAHELGHWQMNHTLKLMGFGQAIVILNLGIFSIFLFNPVLYQQFGFHPDGSEWSMPLAIGFMLAQGIISPLDTIIEFVNHAISRAFEFQADNFAYVRGYGQALQCGLAKLGKENASLTDFDWLYSAYKNSHPTMIERFAALEKKGGKDN